MKLNDLLAPALIGIAAFAVDAIVKGPLGIMILLYATLPGIIDAILAFGAYAAMDHFVSPMIGLQSYPTDFILALALGYLSFTMVVNYFLAPYRISTFRFKRYFFSRYSHLKALLGISLISVWPFAYVRHAQGLYHIERAYESLLAVLLFVYVLTPLHEYLAYGHVSKAHTIVLSKAEGSLPDAGIEIRAEEMRGFNGRTVRFNVKNEEERDKQYILVFEAPDLRVPNVIRTRRIEPHGTDDVIVLVKPAKQTDKARRNLIIHVYDVDGGYVEKIPGHNEEPRHYEFYEKKFSLGGFFTALLLILVPLASIFIPAFYLKIGDIRVSIVSLLLTILIGATTLKVVSKISGAERPRRVVTWIDELAALMAIGALATFLIGLITKSLKIFTITILLSLAVLFIAIISPLVTPTKVETTIRKEQLAGRLIALIPEDPDYFEENLATRAHIIIDGKEFKRLFGVDEARVFIYGDDYVTPSIIDIKVDEFIDIPIWIIPDGFGEREIVVRFGRARYDDGSVTPVDDSDVLTDQDGTPAVFILRYRTLPAGSAGVPREIQQLSMKAIAFIISPTMLINVLNYLGLGTTSIFLSVFFGALGALPIVMYIYYKNSLS